MPRAEEVTPDLLRAWPLPEPKGDKRDRGDVHVVGGTRSTPGAVLLAGLACLRVGAGRLTISTVEELTVPLAVAVPEAAVHLLDGLADSSQPDAFVVGPGLTEPGDLVATISTRCGSAGLVVDAGALRDLHEGLPARTVLTPNGKELRELAGTDGEDQELVRRVSAARGAVVASGGWIAAPDGGLWHDSTGSVALATSGSGDVLAGAIGGLLARGASAEQAACWGTHLHAAAGELLAPRRGRVGLLARELLDALPVGLSGLS